MRCLDSKDKVNSTWVMTPEAVVWLHKYMHTHEHINTQWKHHQTDIKFSIFYVYTYMHTYIHMYVYLWMNEQTNSQVWSFDIYPCQRVVPPVFDFKPHHMPGSHTAVTEPMQGRTTQLGSHYIKCPNKVRAQRLQVSCTGLEVLKEMQGTTVGVHSRRRVGRGRHALK